VNRLFESSANSLESESRFRERRPTDGWLISGRPPLSAFAGRRVRHALSRRPLESAEGMNGAKPGWIIPSGQTRTIP